MRSNAGALIVGALLLAACQDDVKHGRFDLVRTEAGALPALLGERLGCRYEAVGGFVELREDNAYTAELQRRRVCAPEAMGDTITSADTTFTDSGDGTFTVEGDSVFFRHDYGASAGIGAFRGDTLVVQGPAQTLYYRWQGSR